MKPRAIRGMNDILPEESGTWSYLESVLRDVVQSYGYAEIRLPLLWIGVLHGRINASLAATTGVHSPAELIKYLLAGADVVMSTSGMLRHGIGFLTTLVEGLRAWMEAREYESVEQLRGSMSQINCLNPDAFERANYIKILENYKAEYE